MINSNDPLAFADAIDKAKACIDAALAGFDRDVAVVALAQAAKQRAAEKTTSGGTERARVDVAAKSARTKAEPRKRVRRARPKKVDGSHGDKTTTLLSLLTKRPGMPLREVAKAVYGAEDRQAQKNLRSLLSAQSKAGKVRKMGPPGQWEIVPTS